MPIDPTVARDPSAPAFAAGDTTLEDTFTGSHDAARCDADEPPASRTPLVAHAGGDDANSGASTRPGPAGSGA